MNHAHRFKKLSVPRKIIIVCCFVVLVMAITLATYLSISIYRSGKNQGVAIATSSSPVKQAPLNSVNGIPSELGIASISGE